jgi:hypothetical protein
MGQKITLLACEANRVESGKDAGRNEIINIV